MKKKKAPKDVKGYKLLKTSLKYQGKVFFEESTLHGVRYIAESGRPFVEKLMWFVCVVAGAIATIVIIFSLWEKFQTNPTITGLDTDFHSWDVQFPAVTICPVNPGSNSSIRNFMESSGNSDNDEMEAFLIMLTRLTYLTMKDFKNYTDKNFLKSEEDLKKFVFKLMKPCEEIFKVCEFKAESYNCCAGFFPIFTENGFCYTFNSKHYEVETPWQNESLGEIKLEYIKETDTKWSLKFTVNGDAKEATAMDNIAIYVHSSDEIPGFDFKPQHLWDFRAKRLLFSVKQTYTTDDARQLSIKQRHCIFNDEIKLKIDNSYTYTACTQQCRMSNAVRLCKCVPYFYHEEEDHSFPHCKIKELSCIADNLAKIESTERCKCLLGCSNTVYEVEKLTDATEGSSDAKELETEFVSWPMVRYKREVLFGWVDLLVSFGGIAGLFLGFSLLSGVEVIYYFTIRACCMVYKEKDELVKIKREEEHKKKPDYDLSLIPYFYKDPIQGDGRHKIMKQRKNRHINFPTNIKQIKVKPMKQTTAVPPFGIEFIN